MRTILNVHVYFLKFRTLEKQGNKTNKKQLIVSNKNDAIQYKLPMIGQNTL